MASEKAGITKSMVKHAGRAKEKFLQSLGKAEKTVDEVFDEYRNNFTKQETAANRLHKEVKNYVTCFKALQLASKSLFDALHEIYEPEWAGRELLLGRAQTVELLYGDLNHKLNDQVMCPLNIYQSQFPDVRRKVEKRGRKLVDYDSSRHNYESQHSAKKRDEAKMIKAREQMEEARRLYEHLNRELYDELPALYDSRVPFFVSNLQSLFIAESIFHAETAKVNSEMSEILDKLAEENSKGCYISRRPHINSPGKGQSILREDGGQYEEIEFKDEKKKLTNGETIEVIRLPGSSVPSSPTENKALVNSIEENHIGRDGKRLEELYDIPVGATTDNLPPGVLYKVRATFVYEGEDTDELSFDVGEAIQVVEYDDPTDQEEGWLMGIKESTGQKGLFPANFTRPI